MLGGEEDEREPYAAYGERSSDEPTTQTGLFQQPAGPRRYSTRNRRTGPSTFFSIRSPTASHSINGASRSRVASLTMIWPASATAASRAAMFVVMPDAVYVHRVPARPSILVAPSEAGPVLMPMCMATGSKPSAS